MNYPKQRISGAWIAGIGFLLVALPLVFVSTSVLESMGVASLTRYVDFLTRDPAGLNLLGIFWPSVFLGGLFMAFATNMFQVINFKFEINGRSLISTFTVVPRLQNLAVATMSSLLLTMMLGYAIVENFAVS